MTDKISNIIGILVIIALAIMIIVSARLSFFAVSSSRDYQLDVHRDTAAALLYDGSRLIGRMPYKDVPLLDTLLQKDNE